MQPENDGFIEDDFTDAYDEELSERPRGVRFGEGQPINRLGRPRGSPNQRTMTKRVAMQRHKVTIDGKSCRKSTLELVLLSLRKKAAQGDVKGFKLQRSLLQKLAPRQEGRSAVLILPTRLTCDEWEAVYDSTFPNENVTERFPYLMRERKAHQQYTADIDRELREAQAVDRSKN